MDPRNYGVSNEDLQVIFLLTEGRFQPALAQPSKTKGYCATIKLMRMHRVQKVCVTEEPGKETCFRRQGTHVKATQRKWQARFRKESDVYKGT